MTDGIDVSESWIRVYFQDQLGWISIQSILDAGELPDLPYISLDIDSPFSKFQIVSVLEPPPCPEAQSGLVIYVRGPGEAMMNINGFDIHVGSVLTIYNRSQSILALTVHKGSIVGGGDKEIGEGETVDAVLDENGAIIEFGAIRETTELENQLGERAQIALTFLDLDPAIVVDRTSRGDDLESTETSTANSTCNASPLTHIVQHGDTIYLISLKYGVSMEKIIQANDLPNPRLIHAGLVLVIPNSC